MKSFYYSLHKILLQNFFSHSAFNNGLSFDFNKFISINLFKTSKLNHKNFH